MTTDLVFGAAIVGDNVITCVTRDGREWPSAGPANMDNGDHCMSMRFDLGGSWMVTFRRFSNSDRYGEIHAEKNGCQTGMHHGDAK